MSDIVINKIYPPLPPEEREEAILVKTPLVLASREQYDMPIDLTRPIMHSMITEKRPRRLSTTLSTVKVMLKLYGEEDGLWVILPSHTDLPRAIALSDNKIEIKEEDLDP